MGRNKYNHRPYFLDLAQILDKPTLRISISISETPKCKQRTHSPHEANSPSREGVTITAPTQGLHPPNAQVVHMTSKHVSFIRWSPYHPCSVQMWYVFSARNSSNSGGRSHMFATHPSPPRKDGGVVGAVSSRHAASQIDIEPSSTRRMLKMSNV